MNRSQPGVNEAPPEGGEGIAGSRVRAYVAPSVPYVAMLVGLYLLSNAWISILLYHAGALAILSFTKGWRWPPAAGEHLDRRVVLMVVLGSATIGPLLYSLWSTVKLTDIILEQELAHLGLSGAAWPLFVVYYFTVNPVVEELFWRGYLGDPRIGPTPSDLWFAGYHLLVLALFVEVPWVAASFIGLIGGGWLWRQLARCCGGLVLPVLSHAVADASLIWAVYILAA